MSIRIGAHVILQPGDSVTDRVARLLATQHERAVFEVHYRTWKHYLWLTLTVPDNVGYAEVLDMTDRLERAGAAVSVRQGRRAWEPQPH